MKFSEEEKAMWLEDWRRSGKSAWTYARENGLVPQTFAKWAKGKDGAQQCFVEVAAPMMPAQRQVPEILIEKGEVRIHIPLALGREELRAVMEGLGCAT
jgi:hypothetical protein